MYRPLHNRLLCGDTLYDLDDAYVAGAEALRQDVSFHANPYPTDSDAYSQWDYGHTNEAAGEHFRFGRDVLRDPRNRTEINEDPDTPRDDNGEIEHDWLTEQRKRLLGLAA